MIVNGRLSLLQQERSRKNYSLFSLLNGISYMCLGETVILLFAMKLGCPDWVVAVLGSFIYLGNLFMPAGKYATARIGAAKSIALFWVLRNIAAIIVASASLVAFFISRELAIWLVIVCAFMFYSFRSAGTVMIQPLLGEITTSENAGKFTASSTRNFYISCLLVLGIICVVLKYNQSLWTFSFLIATGSMFGFTASTFLAKIDETEAMRISAREPILKDLAKTIKDKLRYQQLFACFVINTAAVMTLPISILVLKRGYGISDTDALLFSMIQFGGSILFSYICSGLAEYAGPRPLAVIFYAMFIVVCVFWRFTPDTLETFYSLWPFLLGGAGVMGAGNAMLQYFLMSVPPKERVVSSLTIYVASGVGAGVAGMFLAGTLLKLIPTFQGFRIEGLDVYRIYFNLTGILIALAIPLVSGIEPLKGWKVRDVLTLLFAPRDMFTLYTLSGFKSIDRPESEEKNINKLKEMHSDLSEKALISSLNSPKFLLRMRAMSALGEIQLSDEGKKAVLYELEHGEHTTGNMAAQIAGTSRIVEAIPLLRKYLDSTDLYLRSKAMVALTQLKDQDSYEKICDIFMRTKNPRMLAFGAAALTEIHSVGAFEFLMRKITSGPLHETAKNEILCSISELTGNGDEAYIFLKLYRTDRQLAIQMLAEQLSNCRMVPELDNGINGLEKLLTLLYGNTGESKFLGKACEVLKESPIQNILPELVYCLLQASAKLPVKEKV